MRIDVNIRVNKKLTQKEVLKLLKRRTRRKIKKHEKRIKKDPKYQEWFDRVVDDTDRFLAYGDTLEK